MSDDVNALSARMTEAYLSGGYAAAEPHATQLLARVDKWYLRTHRDAVYLRAHVRHILSQAANERGDQVAARAHIAAGLRAAETASRLRDVRIAFEIVMLLIARAEQHLLAGETAAASADHDTALEIEDQAGHPMWWEAQVHLRLARAGVRQDAGALDQAEAEAHTALALASEHEPRLVSLCLDRLALLRRLVGATDSAEHRVKAAEAIAATQPLDADRRGERARHAASHALEQGDADAAERYLDEADQAFLQLGDRRRAASTAAARAEVLRLRGDTDGAIRAARSAAERCNADGQRAGEIEAFTVLGLALEDAGRSAEALDAHDDARALVTEPVELVRVDVRRAVAAFNVFVRRANEQVQQGEPSGQSGQVQQGEQIQQSDPGTRTDVDKALARAVDIAVPCALAAEAVRFDMPAGELREAWAGQVSRRIVDTALQILTVAERADEILDLLEHVAASAALETLRDEEPPDRDGRVLLLAPPRVRSMPDADSPLEWAVRAVAERYGFTARTDEVVNAW